MNMKKKMQERAIRNLLGDAHGLEKVKYALELLAFSVSNCNAGSRATILGYLGDGASNIQRIFFTWRGTGQAFLLLIAACCGTPNEKPLAFVVSSVLKMLLLLGAFGSIQNSKVDFTNRGKNRRHKKTSWFVLFTWATQNMLFVGYEFLRCSSSKYGDMITLVLGLLPVAVIILFLCIFGLLLAFMRNRNEEDDVLQYLEKCNQFVLEGVRFIWKLAKKKGKVRMGFILAGCFCGTVCFRIYDPIQINKNLWLFTTMVKAAQFMMFVAWAVNLEKNDHIVRFNLEEEEYCTGSAEWCCQILEYAALVNLLTAVPVDLGVAIVVIALLLNCCSNMGVALKEVLKSMKKMEEND